MRRLALLTSGRQDWGILHSTARRLRANSDFDLTVLVGGMHLHSDFGHTVDLVRAAGFSDAAVLDWLGPGQVPAPAQQASRAMELVFDALDRVRPEAVLLLGDRFETLAAGIAAVLARVPIVHLHGGEESEGAFDNSFRHALSKLAHLHLVAHPDYRDRLIRMGEREKDIHVVGAPGLDNLHRTDLMTHPELEISLGGKLCHPLVSVTYHSATLAPDPLAEARGLVGAMDATPATYVVSAPNSDTGSNEVRRLLESACGGRADRLFVGALGERRYWSLLKAADAMLGNSSSGMIEASAVSLPVVNIGRRQDGRLRSANILDVPEPTVGAITQTLRHALDPAFRESLRELAPPFGDGHAAEKIEEILGAWTPPDPPVKLGVAP